MKKDEKSRLKLEAEERRARISEHEQALRREAAQRVSFTLLVIVFPQYSFFFFIRPISGGRV